ncbi:two-component sensor histidine kinase [Rhodoferax lacus]|uniref:histidine kinase n=1 Tax=Rhodoferax lacus TaxID=2184758 RepID=A0A3E1R5T5_9BURK|nr:ATP-binding protein [Rhodoferax lacus]RFO94716.1 two-component sensor histidine kinase [Rhodoferax lacus]
MRSGLFRPRWWMLAWLLLALAGAVLLVRAELGQQREVFDTNARIFHRLLSQRVVQHDAILATLALLSTADDGRQPEQRLASVYPQIVALQRRSSQARWPTAALDALDADSRLLGRAVLVDTDLAAGRYRILLGAQPSSYLLTIDVPSMVPRAEWPTAPGAAAMRLTLQHGGQSAVLQAGSLAQASPWGWDFSASKVLAAESQPLDLLAQRHVGWDELPWGRVGLWLALLALLAQASSLWLRQREERNRAQELLRLGAVARLNTLGELAAGMAHELNQPLTAVLANTQAASRLLAEDEPELDTVRQAMEQAVGQARRASAVLGRMRSLVEQPGLGAALQPLVLQDAVRRALHLLEPELQRRQVRPLLKAPGAALLVQAEPVALDQIIHNLLMNALQALERSSAGERRLTLSLAQDGTRASLSVQDNGPGLSADVLAHLFEPFFTTREGGLGLGLPLCETLAGAMAGSITARNATPAGAEFVLSLPLATPTPATP